MLVFRDTRAKFEVHSRDQLSQFFIKPLRQHSTLSMVEVDLMLLRTMYGAAFCVCDEDVSLST